jgi:hypothetical protein
MSFQFKCASCGQIHDGIPSYGADRPQQFWEVPEGKRESDVFLTSDSCIIADRFFFIRGCIDIHVIGTSELFTWGVWASLKEENFFIWQESYETAKRSHLGPFFGWLSTRLPTYPDTLLLKTMVHLRDNGIRPRIELETSDHPLAVEQREGITLERLGEIIHSMSGDQFGPPNG